MKRPSKAYVTVVIADDQFDIEFTGGVAQIVFESGRIVLDSVAAANSLTAAAVKAQKLLLADRVNASKP